MVQLKNIKINVILTKKTLKLFRHYPMRDMKDGGKMKIIKEYDSTTKRVRLISENGFLKLHTAHRGNFSGGPKWRPWGTFKELREDFGPSHEIMYNLFNEFIKKGGE